MTSSWFFILGLTGTSLKEQATSEMIVDCIDEYIMQPTKQIRFYMKGEEKVSPVRFSPIFPVSTHSGRNTHTVYVSVS